MFSKDFLNRCNFFPQRFGDSSRVFSRGFGNSYFFPRTVSEIIIVSRYSTRNCLRSFQNFFLGFFHKFYRLFYKNSPKNLSAPPVEIITKSILCHFSKISCMSTCGGMSSSSRYSFKDIFKKIIFFYKFRQ